MSGKDIRNEIRIVKRYVDERRTVSNNKKKKKKDILANKQKTTHGYSFLEKRVKGIITTIYIRLISVQLDVP